MNAEVLKEILLKLSLREMVVKVEMSRRKFIARVISPDYEDQEDWVRQQKVWSLLLDELTEQQCEMIAFVFTDTPEEYKKLRQEVKEIESG